MKHTIEFIETTGDECDFVATCHYIQAEGNKKRRIQLGLPAFILNLAIGSVLIADLGKIIPDPVKWIAAIISLIVSLLVGIQTFFKFDEEEKKHRELGNDFNKISRRLALLIAGWLDKTTPDAQLAADVGKIMEDYEVVCAENEKCPPARNIAMKLKKSWSGPAVQKSTGDVSASGAIKGHGESSAY